MQEGYACHQGIASDCSQDPRTPNYLFSDKEWNGGYYEDSIDYHPNIYYKFPKSSDYRKAS